MPAGSLWGWGEGKAEDPFFPVAHSLETRREWQNQVQSESESELSIIAADIPSDIN